MVFNSARLWPIGDSSQFARRVRSLDKIVELLASPRILFVTVEVVRIVGASSKKMVTTRFCEVSQAEEGTIP
jgi:hypothetical protein